MENIRQKQNKTLHSWGFLIVCAVTLVVLLTGALLKCTVLGDRRVSELHKYQVTYTIVVSDLDENTADMFTENMGIYLDESTTVGAVSQVKAAPAASGQEGLQDITLYVDAIAANLSKESPESCTFSDAPEMEFQTRFLSFTGKITAMEVLAS